jgi:hypothetical protein
MHQAVLELFLILADRKGNFAFGCGPRLFLPCPHSFDSSLEFFRWKKRGVQMRIIYLKLPTFKPLEE